MTWVFGPLDVPCSGDARAHGSGGRRPNLANLCCLAARTLLPPLHIAKIIPYIFRIMSGRSSGEGVVRA